MERRLREREAVREWERRVRGAGKSPRILVCLQVVGADGHQFHVPLLWMQGGEYPVRVLGMDEAELILDRIRVHVQSGTTQIMTNNPML